MNILCINYEYPPIGGGGGVVSRGLARTLVQMGHNIDIVTSQFNGLPAYEEQDGIHIHRVKCSRRHKHYVTAPEMLTHIIPSYRKALELTQKKTYDLNHTHFLVPSGIVSYMLWKKTGLPYVITAHGSDVPGYNPDRFDFIHKMINLYWKKIIRNSQRITTPSQYLKELLQKNIKIAVDVIPNGYESRLPFQKEKKTRILLVTRIFERKGVQFFLEAMADLPTEWEILIAGDGPYLPVLKEKAKRCANPIHFLGLVQGDELMELYQSAKIFVFPSIQENFPVVLLEAMTAGCAVITTTAPGCAEVVGNAAIKIPPGSVSELRAAIRHLINNEGEIIRYGLLSTQRAAEFSWPIIAQKFDALFRECTCRLQN
jgi:glycosyltransferase involved in cell wall biosynthesis